MTAGSEVSSLRTCFCGEVVALLGQELSLCGWVHRRRDHGGVIFLDLRDYTGTVQLVCEPAAAEAFVVADGCRNEYVVRAIGLLRHRPEGTENPAMATGLYELLIEQLEVLNPAQTPAFQLDEHIQTGEDVRLHHRYLDLRRPELQHNLRFRSRLSLALRQFLDARRFIEIETPVLTRPTPEGARDYLVPSRVHPGSSYALPQSPQLFKQLLMASGMDRYYQIARCFRDEDLRADRQPEFTQLDIELSFASDEEIMALNEEMLRHIFGTLLDVELADFPRISYDDALSRYGVDRPDLRIPLELTDIDDLVADIEFRVFSGPAGEPGSRVVALRVPGGIALSRGAIDNYTEDMRRLGAKGLAWIRVDVWPGTADDLNSPILKFIPEAVIAQIFSRAGVGTGDLVFFGAGPAALVNLTMGALRVQLGHDLQLLAPGWHPCWVVDFPVFERDAQTGALSAVHHPFTAPVCDLETLREAPEEARARAYDIVFNGIELGGGSVRIHDAQMQRALLELLGIGSEEAQEQFGFLLRALDAGCPPHGGIAYGLDRMAMMMIGASSLREVIAFPKTQSAICQMTGAPVALQPQQLREFGLELPQPRDPGKSEHGRTQ